MKEIVKELADIAASHATILSNLVEQNNKLLSKVDALETLREADFAILKTTSDRLVNLEARYDAAHKA